MDMIGEEMTPTLIGKWMMIAGALLAVAGGAVWLAGRAGLPLGSLPGDFHAEGEHYSFRFPVATCIVISVVLTILINLAIRFLGK